jgi:DNA end-binding protein Ku
MPRPSWNGQLRLSLVSCPIYLSPATSEADRIRLHMINPETGNRISMRTVDSETGEEIARDRLVKGYEVEKGQYVILEPEEIEALAVESSRVLNLASFIDRAEVDPLYISTPYYVYPDKGGEEAYRVIAQAMANKKRAALGRIVLSTREHPVMVEPFDDGLLMSVLRSPDEVRVADWSFKGGKLDAEMVDLAETIMDRLKGEWQPEEFRDRYQEALRELIEAKQRGTPIRKGAPPAPEPSNVVDLMAVLKRSVAGKGAGKEAQTEPAVTAKPKRRTKVDRRQRSMLLPVEGKGTAGKSREAAGNAAPTRGGEAKPSPSKTTRRRRA